MHPDVLSQHVYYALNKELLRRMLIKYFFDKGFKEDINRRIYPPSLLDLPVLIPHLDGKVEIQPHVEDIDPQTGVATLGWNLFVLGNKRMYLGESTHSSLNEIQAQIGIPDADGIKTIEYVTPKKVISFIVEVLSTSHAGDIGKLNSIRKKRTSTPLIGRTNEQMGSFFRLQNRTF
jgi:hypothetical protein